MQGAYAGRLAAAMRRPRRYWGPAQLQKRSPAMAGLRIQAWRCDSVVALRQVVVGHDFSGGPFQRLALLALALGFVDSVDVRMVDPARGDLAPREPGRLVGVF